MEDIEESMVSGERLVVLSTSGEPMRRWHIFTIGAVLALGLGMRMLVVAAWVGGKTLSVKVLVIDSEVPCPVTGARVVAFRRPFSLWEGDITRRKPADFIPHTGSPETKSFVTDDKGWCCFDHRFWAAGTSGWLRNSGYVDTSRIWLQVSADDRPTTLVPLDCQSVHPRDIHDKTPLIVTVVLNKNGPSNHVEAGASR